LSSNRIVVELTLFSPNPVKMDISDESHIYDNTIIRPSGITTSLHRRYSEQILGD